MSTQIVRWCDQPAPPGGPWHQRPSIIASPPQLTSGASGWPAHRPTRGLTGTGLPTSAEEMSFTKGFMLTIKARNQTRNPPQARNRRGCVCSSHYHNQGELHGKHDQQRGVAGGKGECE